jgi:hypothetical protein
MPLSQLSRRLSRSTTCVLAAAAALAPVTGCGGGGGSSSYTQPEFRTVAIPYRDPVYGTFKAQVFESQAELDQFLAQPFGLATNDPAYLRRDRVEFVQALQTANVDFEKQALVLLPQYVVGVSADIALDAPRLQGRTLVSTMRIGEGNVCCGVSGYYGFALAVSKTDVDDIRIFVEVTNPRTVGALTITDPYRLTVED